MSEQSVQTVLFPTLFAKSLVAAFDTPQQSSDGGAILLKAIDAQLGLTARLAACLPEWRQVGKVEHDLPTLIRQRCFGLACGYPDANDAARLKDDPIHKLLVGRDPVAGPPLASQPTLSRFENAIATRDLVRLTHALADVVIAHHQARLGAQRVRRITIDLDPTDDPTHGQQELAFFNGHYDTWCYLPVVGYLTFNKEREQYLVTALLRPGNVPASRGAIGLLRRLFAKLRAAFPKATLRVRLDGGYATPPLFAFLEAEGVEYLVAMASNARLAKRIRRLLGKARMRSKASGQTEHLYGETRYAAKKWRRKRRVIMKAEVVRLGDRDPRDNPRFVVTNLPQTPRHVYALYCERGDRENRIKELHYGLGLDRTSCSRFRANAFRVVLTAAAYVLLQELRRHLAATACAGSQVGTLRERLLKLGTRVSVSARRIVLHLPSAFPWLVVWQAVALALGARAG
ncbi:MAG TPA: IS1380 family transposase [bacterium]|nr:IS1380 family transposase [bacterium]